MFKTTTGMAALALLVSKSEAVKLSYRPKPAHYNSNYGGGEPWHKSKMTEPSWLETKEYGRNYFVPNFGTDDEILANHKNLKKAEGEIGHDL